MLNAVNIIAEIIIKFATFFLISELAYKSIIYPAAKRTIENITLK
jgi:hypothetical protein